jgi:Zn-dependent M28 family amino/carboxypeptidase
MHPSLAERLRAHVQTLAATPRPPGSPAHRKAAAHVEAHLRQAGFAVEPLTLSDAGYTALNLVTRPLPDRPDLPLVLVAAHYDSIPDSPGADDNASAVAALLEVARLVRPALDAAGPWHARLQLIAYDLEEYGLIGSYLHSRDLRRAGADLRGMLSLEMLGYTDERPGSQGLPPDLKHLYPDVGDFIGVVGNEASRDLLGVVVAGLKVVAGLPVESLAVPGNGELLPPARLSDHSPFWDQGFPALMVSDTSFFRNPHYHQAGDTPDTLDYAFLARVTEGLRAAVLELLTRPTLAGTPGG